MESKNLESFDFDSIEATRQWAGSYVKTLGPKHIILLCGQLGAGKTQLVRFFASALGGDLEACSPSFAIHNRYETPVAPIDHLDLYRLESEEDLESTGFWDLFEQSHGYIFIEWADRLDTQYLPRSWPVTRVEIKRKSEAGESRSIRVERLD